jgi:tetratricopeptide (TPR) repeat protein
VQRGSVAEGMEKVERAFAGYRAQEAGLGIPWVISGLVPSLIAIGRLDKAKSLLDDALAIVELKGERHSEAELLRLQGELKAAEGDLDGAAERYRTALSVARTQGAKALELRAATGLARLLALQGRPQEARGLLAPLIDWFTEGLDAPDLTAARAQLSALASSCNAS